MVQRRKRVDPPPKTTDEIVGERIREARTAAGMTQVGLAEQIGVSYQQLQKYENGSNRLTVGRLHIIATVLQVPIQDFFVDTGVPHDEYVFSNTSRQALAAFNRLPAERRSKYLALMLDEAPAPADA